MPGAPFQISQPPIRAYVTLLSRIFLLEELPPWHSNRMKRLVKMPKLHIGDTGLACTLLGLDAETLWQDCAVFGRLLKTFICQELRRHASWQEACVNYKTPFKLGLSQGWCFMTVRLWWVSEIICMLCPYHFDGKETDVLY